LILHFRMAAAIVLGAGATAAAAEDDAVFAAAVARLVEDIAAAEGSRIAAIPPGYRAEASACMARELAVLTEDEKLALIHYEDAARMVRALETTTRATPAFGAIEACFQAAADAAGIR